MRNVSSLPMYQVKLFINSKCNEYPQAVFIGNNAIFQCSVFNSAQHFYNTETKYNQSECHF